MCKWQPLTFMMKRLKMLMAISQSYQRFNNNNNIKNRENQQKSGGNFLCVCSNNALIVATKNGELRFNLINGLLSVVGCRLSVLKCVYKDLYHMFDAEKEQKNFQKKKEMPANTNYTFHKSANAFAHCSSRSHSLFSLQNTRSEKCRSNIFSGIFLYSGIFLNFFFPNLFPMDFFVIFFPSHAKHFS